MTTEPARQRETDTSEDPSDHYYQHMCEHAGIAMISTDRNLMIRTWNAAAAHMFGASAASMIGTPIVSVIPTEGREQSDRLIRQAIEMGEITNDDFEHRDAQGKARSLTVTMSPVVDDDGNTVGALACFGNITRRIQLEAELASAGKMASLGEMAGALAHYLNNMLGGAVTSIDFALGTDIPNLQVRALRQTGEALARAGKLLNSLLAFAEGDQRPQDQRQINDVVREVAQRVQPELLEANITLDLRLDPRADFSVPLRQFTTVLENVLHNAADAMPNGGSISIEMPRTDGRHTLVISDTGCGMEDQSLKRVFEPFYTTKSRELDFEHHPGLGMAVAHGILQRLGHDIWITSTVDTGTQVHIRFRSSESDLTRDNTAP